MVSSADITIVIPTYRREAILIDTLKALLSIHIAASEILVVDQTTTHERPTWEALKQWLASGAIRRLSFSPPSIPRAMNIGLVHARSDYVLFLDDDILPSPALISSLVQAFRDCEPVPVCITGQVIQPGESVIPYETWKRPWFPFNSDRRQFISDVMAGNLCIQRQFALSIGGFDENFKGAAFNFESEFARRVIRAGGRILFEPTVSIRHLRTERGGTRSSGGQLTTWRPHHSVGKYYFAFLRGPGEALKAVLVQPLRAIRTKHHLKAPWWIPATLFAEISGILWAIVLKIQGQKFVARADHANTSLVTMDNISGSETAPTASPAQGEDVR